MQTARTHRSTGTLVTILLVVLVASGLAIGAGSAAGATGTGVDFAPSARPRELHMTRTEQGIVSVLHWRGSSRFRMLQFVDIDPVDERTVLDVAGPTSTLGSGFPGALHDVAVGRNVAQVAPDGSPNAETELLGYVWPLVARVRSGGAALTPVTVGGRALLRGVTSLAANECAGASSGRRVVHLDAATLVPVRVVERRGGRITTNVTFANRRARASDFAPLTVIGRRQLRDEGFVRRSPGQAAALASYPILLPSTLPAGFTLAFTGSAPLGGWLGPEGSFPRSAGVFFAKYTRGIETIDFTIRPARSTLIRDWDESDPFGSECEHTTRTDVAIGTGTGRYAVGEFGAPRLWWRDAATLYTLSGPFGASELVAIAESLGTFEATSTATRS